LIELVINNTSNFTFMTQPIPQKYRTTNWKNYSAALRQRGAMLIWIDKNMAWNGTPTGKRGSFKTYSDQTIQFCLTIKSLYRLGLRQTEGMVESTSGDCC
jgi:hypothetical protein